jgi:hypothetical protein
MDLLDETVRLKDPRLFEFLRLLIADTRSTPDLEVVLQRLEEYIDIVTRLEKDSLTGQYFSTSEGFKTFTKLIRSLDDITRDLIFEHYRIIDENKVTKGYRDLLELLSNMNTGRFLPIFTTNYDLAIEAFVDANSDDFTLIDGFQPNYRGAFVWSPQRFADYVPAIVPKREIILFKLHGSIFWYQLNREASIYKMLYSSRKAPGLRNVLLYPAQTKNNSVEPFSTCYRYLEELLGIAKY